MQCPKYDLDYCFSYEGEDVQGKIAAFFAGKLKMGMGAIPSEEMIQGYRDYHRGLRQYKLYLPLEAKKRLWEILDNKVAEGMYLPYDYLRRGCAQTSFDFLMQALDTTRVAFAPWPEKYHRTIREIFSDYTQKRAPWSLLCIHAITGTSCDASLPPRKKIILPTDLVEVLQTTTIKGEPIIREEPIELSTGTVPQEKTLITPIIVALCLLFLAIGSLFVKGSSIDYLLLGLQTSIGLFVLYLLLGSTLPSNGWNWLIIPFNPFPAICWKWRKKWAKWFILLLVAWMTFILLSPHRLTDNAFIVLAVALLLMYIKQAVEFQMKQKQKL